MYIYIYVYIYIYITLQLCHRFLEMQLTCKPNRKFYLRAHVNVIFRKCNFSVWDFHQISYCNTNLLLNDCSVLQTHCFIVRYSVKHL